MAKRICFLEGRWAERRRGGGGEEGKEGEGGAGRGEDGERRRGGGGRRERGRREERKRIYVESMWSRPWRLICFGRARVAIKCNIASGSLIVFGGFLIS